MAARRQGHVIPTLVFLCIASWQVHRLGWSASSVWLHSVEKGLTRRWLQRRAVTVPCIAAFTGHDHQRPRRQEQALPRVASAKLHHCTGAERQGEYCASEGRVGIDVRRQPDTSGVPIHGELIQLHGTQLF